LRFCLVGSLLQLFVFNWIEVLAVRRATNLEVHIGDHALLRLLHFRTVGSE